MRRRKFLWDKVITFTIIAVTVFWGIHFKINQKDIGIAGFSKLDDIKEDMVILNYAWGNAAGLTEDDFGEGDDKYGVDAAEVIVVVSPTGNIHPSEGCIGQEVVIKDIIRGEKLADIGDTSWVYKYFGFCEIDGKIEYMDTLNLMDPENEYLMFLNASPLNTYTNEAIYTLQSSQFGYVKIDGKQTGTLDRDYTSYDFTELRDYEFFSQSEEVTDVLNSVREEILNIYYKNF